MTGKRKRCSAEFKAKIALEALRGELTVSQLATKHGVHQTLIGDWKRRALERVVLLEHSPPRPRANGRARSLILTR